MGENCQFGQLSQQRPSLLLLLFLLVDFFVVLSVLYTVLIYVRGCWFLFCPALVVFFSAFQVSHLNNVLNRNLLPILFVLTPIGIVVTSQQFLVASFPMFWLQ